MLEILSVIVYHKFYAYERDGNNVTKIYLEVSVEISSWVTYVIYCRFIRTTDSRIYWKNYGWIRSEDDGL
jgi:hypothetical protein